MSKEDKSTDAFDDLLSGPNTVKELGPLRSGKMFLVRSGSRSERNKILKKAGNPDLLMDAVALTIYLRAANPDGSKRFASEEFREFAEALNYDDASEMAMLIAKLDEPEEDELTLDQKTEKQLKNSKRQKEAT